MAKRTKAQYIAAGKKAARTRKRNAAAKKLLVNEKDDGKLFLFYFKFR